MELFKTICTFMAPDKFEIGNEFYRAIINPDIMTEVISNNGCLDLGDHMSTFPEKIFLEQVFT